MGGGPQSRSKVHSQALNPWPSRLSGHQGPRCTNRRKMNEFWSRVFVVNSITLSHFIYIKKKIRNEDYTITQVILREWCKRARGQSVTGCITGASVIQTVPASAHPPLLSSPWTLNKKCLAHIFGNIFISRADIPLLPICALTTSHPNLTFLKSKLQLYSLVFRFLESTMKMFPVSSVCQKNHTKKKKNSNQWKNAVTWPTDGRTHPRHMGGL